MLLLDKLAYHANFIQHLFSLLYHLNLLRLIFEIISLITQNNRSLVEFEYNCLYCIYSITIFSFFIPIKRDSQGEFEYL